MSQKLQWNDQATVPRELRLHIRWMIRRDMNEVLSIEQDGCTNPWNEEDFLRCLRQRNCIGMVADHSEKVIGHMIYDLYPKRIGVTRFAVDPMWRRMGVGSAMIAKLMSKMSSFRRVRFTFMVEETNLGGLLFLKSQGGVATESIRDYFDGEDGIKMVFCL